MILELAFKPKKMYNYYPFLNKLLLGAEFTTALISLYYLPKIKYTYWKWFTFYLCFVFIQEFLWKDTKFIFNIKKQEYYAFLGIPFQYLFLYWLYGLKSLKSKKIFFISSLIYLTTFIPFEIFDQKIRILYPVNLTIGSIILIVLVVLEFLKQIRNDNILKFKENKMFYINLGVILFYVGTYPFSAFYHELLKHIDIWNAYYFYFVTSNIFMYLLFAASFIWGKHQS